VRGPSSSSSFADTVLDSSARRGAFAVCLHALETMPLVFGESKENEIGKQRSKEAHGDVIKQERDCDGGRRQLEGGLRRVKSVENACGEG
jgi:hypothetical protein